MSAAAEKPYIIVICGPTGIGKTSTAIDAAEAFGGQIISADSMQIYRYMDIGTAKPTPLKRKKINHHMIDIIDPDEPFDAVQFSEMARDLIPELHENHTKGRKVPLALIFVLGIATIWVFTNIFAHSHGH